MTQNTARRALGFPWQYEALPTRATGRTEPRGHLEETCLVSQEGEGHVPPETSLVPQPSRTGSLVLPRAQQTRLPGRWP